MFTQMVNEPLQATVLRHTGVKLLAIGLQSAPVVNLDLVAFLSAPVTLYWQGDVDLKISSQSANNCRGEKGYGEEDGLHSDGCLCFGEVPWL